MKENLKRLRRDESGDAVVEATILFPIIVLIFFALVMLSVYLPTRAILQRATQYAATAIATEHSDTWLRYDEASMQYRWKEDRGELDNVYEAAVKSILPKANANSDQAEKIVKNTENRVVLTPSGGYGAYNRDLQVSLHVVNYVVYKEIVVTATRNIHVPIHLSIIQFPEEIPITVTSTAVVQNGDEFVRNMDLAVDFIQYLDERYQISSSDAFKNFQSNLAAVLKLLNI
ncbi:TadE/TadG family type IV pilus assembly protein [Paenibacillus albus]|uniref:Pilus assembly protein n=1 Tax=Paenibacillus albus TaxID=2495582 RepID=A0A3Q8X3Z7_9BACL|nr:TadE/TadG family type IV pilus assembly protein [Paenibacillus albus]AZN39940.1 pilus assembly protein [Paenibacillus albus]